MKIGIISDTHGVFRPEWKDILKDCQYLIHAGDFDSKRCYEAFKGLGIPMYMVRGNCDMGEWASNIPEFLTAPIAGKIFYIVHNKSDLPFDLTDADFIVFGHTHQFTHYDRMGKIYINPGSAGQERYDAKSMVILDLREDGYECKRVYC